jgi:(2Fe-2S) ferredoxin
LTRKLTVIVCSGPVCRDKRGSDQLWARLVETVAARGLQGRVRVVDEVCLGHCLRGPNILVHEEPAVDDDAEPPLGAPAPDATTDVLYNRMTLEDLDRVIERHLVGGMAVKILMNRPPHRDR